MRPRRALIILDVERYRVRVVRAERVAGYDNARTGSKQWLDHSPKVGRDVDPAAEAFGRRRTKRFGQMHAGPLCSPVGRALSHENRRPGDRPVDPDGCRTDRDPVPQHKDAAVGRADDDRDGPDGARSGCQSAMPPASVPAHATGSPGATRGIAALSVTITVMPSRVTP